MTVPAKIMTLVASASLMAGCHSAKPGAGESSGDTFESAPISAPVTVNPMRGGGRPASMVAMTHIYKTSGDYADRVPVTLNAAGTEVVSFPSPSDLIDATPVRLADGYLLDRRGVGVNTAFTRYTYAEYGKLSQPPTPDELLKSVIPGAKVTEIVEMPFAAGAPDAASRCDALIREGLPGCKYLLRR